MVYYDNSTNITNVVNVKNNDEDSDKIYSTITLSLVITVTIGMLVFHSYNIYKRSILVFPIEMPHDLPAPRRTSRFFRDDYTDDDDDCFNRTPIEWYELENRLSGDHIN
tara:strand:+ start:638 stop:964 length:327 start_codon:yes stop_codon:yes gene_type:complete